MANETTEQRLARLETEIDGYRRRDARHAAEAWTRANAGAADTASGDVADRMLAAGWRFEGGEPSHADGSKAADYVTALQTRAPHLFARPRGSLGVRDEGTAPGKCVSASAAAANIEKIASGEVNVA